MIEENFAPNAIRFDRELCFLRYYEVKYRKQIGMIRLKRYWIQLQWWRRVGEEVNSRQRSNIAGFPFTLYVDL